MEASLPAPTRGLEGPEGTLALRESRARRWPRVIRVGLSLRVSAYVLKSAHMNVRNVLVLVLTLSAAAAAARVLKINGSTTVNLPVAEAAEILRAERRMNIQVDTQGGSAGGISMLGDGLVQIGMSSKPLERRRPQEVPAVPVQ